MLKEIVEQVIREAGIDDKKFIDYLYKNYNKLTNMLYTAIKLTKGTPTSFLGDQLGHSTYFKFKEWVDFLEQRYFLIKYGDEYVEQYIAKYLENVISVIFLIAKLNEVFKKNNYKVSDYSIWESEKYFNCGFDIFISDSIKIHISAKTYVNLDEIWPEEFIRQPRKIKMIIRKEDDEGELLDYIYVNFNFISTLRSVPNYRNILKQMSKIMEIDGSNYDEDFDLVFDVIRGNKIEKNKETKKVKIRKTMKVGDRFFTKNDYEIDGEIEEIDGDKVLVSYDYGEKEEWVKKSLFTFSDYTPDNDTAYWYLEKWTLSA